MNFYQPKPDISFAEWRPLPPPEPVLSKRLQRIPWRNVLGPIALVFAVIMGPVIFASLLILFFKHANPLSMYGGTISLLNAYYLRARFHRTPQAVREMMDFPATIPQFPVQITFYTATSKVGHDVGVITFIDDILHFEGRQISFDLTRQWADMIFIYQQRKPSKDKRGIYQIDWRGGTHYGKVKVISYRSIPGSMTNYVKEFDAALMSWLETTPIYHDKITLPPVLSRRQSQAQLKETAKQNVTG